MAIKRPDIYEHNNPVLSIVDSDFLRGGGRVVADLTALYALSSKSDQLKERVTRVYVTSASAYYTLIDDANIGNSSGWQLETAGGVTDGDKGDITVTNNGGTWTIDDSVITNAKVSTGIDAAKIANGSVSNAEYQYLANVTSDIQTQIDGKEGTITAGTTAQYFRGDKTFQTLDKAAVGLANVDNTSDANKPISTATQTALDAKEPTVTATTSADYYRGDKTFQTLDKAAVGLSNVDNTSDVNKPISTATQSALDGKEDTITATTSSEYYRGDKVFATLDKAAVGLNNVDNTSDANKPVSTATQTEIDTKVDSLITLNNQTGTTYTLVLTDKDKLIEMENAAANTLTVPLNSSVAFDVGTQILIVQKDAGTTTIAAAAGVTLLSKDSNLDIGGQYGAATCIKIATDTWYVIGDLA